MCVCFLFPKESFFTLFYSTVAGVGRMSAVKDFPYIFIVQVIFYFLIESLSPFYVVILKSNTA